MVTLDLSLSLSSSLLFKSPQVDILQCIRLKSAKLE